MTKSAIWISYDLGVQGDYSSLYAWLDTHGAKECGDSLAFLNYEYSGPIKQQLVDDLKQVMTIDKRTRIYVIYREADTNKNKGAFIFGGRREPPWTGYSPKGVGAVDEEEV
jgi:hypothetical protein